MEPRFFKSTTSFSGGSLTTTSLIKSLAMLATVLVGIAFVAAYAQLAAWRHWTGGGAVGFVLLASSLSLMWICYSRVVVDCLNAMFRFAGYDPDIDQDSAARLATARRNELERARRQMLGGN